MNKTFKVTEKVILTCLQRYLSMDLKANPVSLNFLDGKKVLPSQTLRTLKKCNPAKGTFMFDILCSGKEDVEKAVKSSKKAFNEWSKICPRERGQILSTAARKIREKLEEIAKYEVEDTGKPFWEAKIDIAGCADTFEYFGGIASTISGTHHQLGNNFATVQREPLGVVAGIGAWNYPFQVMTWKVAPALACGNTVVYKPSELTPLTSVLLASILTEAGVPLGAVNVIQGGYETGEYICKHPDISKVTFTGSVPTGQKIVKMCADTMKKVTMELGGKSALLVFPDCNVQNAVKATLLGNFFTQGEVCSNCTRVFVHEKILDQFTNELISVTKKLKVGDPFDKNTKVGAIINENHGNKVMQFIQQAKKEGATIACGGERIVIEGTDLKGYYLSPCILTNCNDEMCAVKEEIFGPVVSILSFNSEKEAIARANASPFGLAAGVMTKDLQRAHRVASALQAGIVWINNYNVFPPEVPFGGYKMSGFGRENSLAAVNEFTQLKTVYVEMNEDIDCPFYS